MIRSSCGPIHVTKKAKARSETVQSDDLFDPELFIPSRDQGRARPRWISRHRIVYYVRALGIGKK